MFSEIKVGKTNWKSDVKHIFDINAFSYVWGNQISFE